MAQQLGARNEFTFFLKVDPIHGDDLKAKSKRNGGLNPNGIWPSGGNYWDLALTKHPHSGFSNSGPLQQAPYSFKTVTAAIQYINGEFVTSNTNWQSKGWKRPNRPGHNENYWIKFIEIQCLPGIYAPKDPGDSVDPRSGLPYNGEAFPLSVPLRVCIQGTSALDTIFDGRHRSLHIFRYAVSGTNSEILWKDCFLDSVTVRGARIDSDQNFPDGAGIYIGIETKIRIVISNCIITDNWVGIAIDSDEDGTYINSPIIVHNTIAWNRVGLWNGDSQTQQAKVGYGKPRVFNNIFDSGDPLGEFGSINSSNTAPHWGLSLGDLTAHFGNGPNVDYNAYEKYRADQVNIPSSKFSLPFWPGTTAQVTIPSSGYSPRVDLLPYTRAGTYSPVRGSLYINDILRHSQGWDVSPHDFRLAFLVSFDEQAPGASNLNPLVDQGISSYPLVFGNGQIVSHEPGLPSPGAQNGTEGNASWKAADYAALHADDWDGEGYGNPRIFDHPAFVDNPDGSGVTDLGFDEVHLLVMGGFIPFTRIFGPCVPDPQGPFLFLPMGDHSKVFFFNLPGTYNRPVFSQYTGQVYTWWALVQETQAVANGSGNLTLGETASFRHKYTTRTSGIRLPPFLKDLECDFSGDLLPDIHPAWAHYFTNLFTPPVLDPFGSNPWYHTPDGISLLSDNPYLYYDPAVSILLEGTPNPPGTTFLYDPQAFGYLKSDSASTGVFGPFGYSGPNTYTVPASPAWGFGDSAGPDVIPDSQWFGVRYNCQADIGLSGQTNVQTFLGVSGPCVINNSQTGKTKNKTYQGGPKVSLPPSPGSKTWSDWKKNLLKEMERRGK